ncbi:peptide ABC transporter ATP-binding protein, partial [Rhizobium johnstonii]
DEIHRDLRIVFPDPQSSIHPRLPVIDIIGEVLGVNGIAKGRELEHRVADLMQSVGLRPECMHRYPHAFSGGERQRIG